MSDRCVRCGKAAVVRRVLPPNDPMGMAGGPQPVCMDCAQLIDGGGALAPMSATSSTSAPITTKRLIPYLLLAGLFLAFFIALFSFFQANNGE
jgi:hypothetical protein